MKQTLFSHHRFSTSLHNAKIAGLYRNLPECRILSPTQGIFSDGKKVTLFCSNDYLGLSFHPQVQQAAAQAAVTQGSGASGSRLLSGGREIPAVWEQCLASWKQTETALLFGSGYMANLGVLSTLPQAGDTIFSDALNHASLIDGCRLSRANIVIYKHCQPADLRLKLQAAPSTGHRWIVTDTVFSMDGDMAPLPELTELAEEFGAWLIVDDAHGTGVLGDLGRGCAYLQGVAHRIDVQTGSCSKALASEGGFAVTSTLLREVLVQKSRPFIFSTAQAPATVAAAQVAAKIIIQDCARREQLQANSRWLRQKLQSIGLSVPDGQTPIIPIFIGAADRAVQIAQTALEKGIWVSAIRPPSVPEGESRLRVTVNALHSQEELVHCAHVLGSVF